MKYVITLILYLVFCRVQEHVLAVESHQWVRTSQEYPTDHFGFLIATT